MTLAVIAATLVGLGVMNAQGARDQAAQLATVTLSRQLGIAAHDLRVVNVAQVEWRDSSLGCPERGMLYTPSMIDGFKVILQAGDKQYEVHTGGGRALICGGPTAAQKLSPNDVVKPALDAAGRARRHLAATLGLTPADVIVKVVHPWRPDDGVCEPPAGTTARGVTYFVELARGAKTYRYRAMTDAAWPCAAEGRVRDPRPPSPPPRLGESGP